MSENSNSIVLESKWQCKDALYYSPCFRTARQDGTPERGKLDMFCLVKCELLVANHKWNSPKFRVISVVLLLRSAFLGLLPSVPGTVWGNNPHLGKGCNHSILGQQVRCGRETLNLVWKSRTVGVSAGRGYLSWVLSVMWTKVSQDSTAFCVPECKQFSVELCRVSCVLPGTSDLIDGDT